MFVLINRAIKTRKEERWEFQDAKQKETQVKTSQLEPWVNIICTVTLIYTSHDIIYLFYHLKLTLNLISVNENVKKNEIRITSYHQIYVKKKVYMLSVKRFIIYYKKNNVFKNILSKSLVYLRCLQTFDHMLRNRTL